MKNAVTEFKNLLNNHLTTISKIEWWLLKYSGEYNRTDRLESSKHLNIEKDGTIVRLPPTLEPNENDKFLCLFRALNKLTVFHKNEDYFRTQMTKYHKIKSSKSELGEWLIENKIFGADKYVCFLIDYLDYDENDNEIHLSVFVHSATELNIFAERADFKYTIEFLETFNELYWAD